MSLSLQKSEKIVPNLDPFNGSLKDLLNNKILMNTLNHNYYHERDEFKRLQLYRTPYHTNKTLYKIMAINFDYVANDVLCKSFNGIKTIFTENTRLFHYFTRFKKARPLSSFKLAYKRIFNFLPKLKEFINFVGKNKGYIIRQQYYDNTENIFKPVSKFIFLKNVKKDLLSSFRNSIKPIGRGFTSFMFKKRFNVRIKMITAGHLTNIRLTGNRARPVSRFKKNMLNKTNRYNKKKKGRWIYKSRYRIKFKRPPYLKWVAIRHLLPKNIVKKWYLLLN